MPAVFITYAIPRAFQLIYSPKGEREGEKTEEGRMQMEEQRTPFVKYHPSGDPS